MILIADSGSTKCDWVAIHANGSEVLRTLTMGFNPFFHSKETISEAINQTVELSSVSTEVRQVYYYGAGCSSSPLIQIVETALTSSFPNAKIEVDHDLKGAALAAYQGHPNVSCILGTGSNACFFDGNVVTEVTPALGFILGDEGSGSYFGKQLIIQFLYGKLPAHIQKDFDETYRLTKPEVINSVYVKPHANVYLASFTPFIFKHKNDPFFQDMLNEGMGTFLQTHVLCYPNAKDLKINFIGSIAYYFKEAVEYAAKNLGLQLGVIIQKPIDHLINYHMRQIN